MGDERYSTHGKGFTAISEDAVRFLDAAITVDEETGQRVLRSDDIVEILRHVQDVPRFVEPLALALYQLVVGTEARIVFPDDDDDPGVDAG